MLCFQIFDDASSRSWSIFSKAIGECAEFVFQENPGIGMLEYWVWRYPVCRSIGIQMVSLTGQIVSKAKRPRVSSHSDR
jgi:hypothetical protein